jgi:GAF domain-containing protein
MVETQLTRAGRERHLAALADLAARPFASLDEAIEAALILISDVIGVRLAMVHRLDGENLVITHACDRLGLGVVPPIVVRCKDTFCDDVLASVAPLLVPDADADPRFRDRLGKKLVGTRTYIGVPILLSDGRLYGTLCAHDRRILDLGRREIETLRILSRQVASQIERDEAAATEAESARQLARRCGNSTSCAKSSNRSPPISTLPRCWSGSSPAPFASSAHTPGRSA